MKMNTKKIAMLGMLAALAYIAVLLVHIPIFPSAPFLDYEPKDVVLTIGGFIFGPLATFALAAVVSLVEMVTISATGIIGCIMNLMGSCAFACTAAWVYKRNHTLKGAVIGLGIGCIAMTAFMILWNYLITPLYMGTPREVVAGMLLPVFLPFNLLKSVLNAGLTLLIYKPLVNGLRRAKLLEPAQTDTPAVRKTGILVTSLIIIATCVLVVLVLQGTL